MFYTNRTKIEAARAFAIFCRTNGSLCRNSIFATLDFRNFGSLAVGQTDVPRQLSTLFQLRLETMEGNFVRESILRHMYFMIKAQNTSSPLTCAYNILTTIAHFEFTM